MFVFIQATCKYSLKDVSPIPAEVKTYKVITFDNRAEYVNARIAPELTEKVRQKISGNTRLKQSPDDDAHYIIEGYINQYNVTTTGITGNNSAENRLNVGFHLIFKNTLDDTKNQEIDLLRSYPFLASRALSEAEGEIIPKLQMDITDDIFNKIFSNW